MIIHYCLAEKYCAALAFYAGLLVICTVILLVFRLHLHEMRHLRIAKVRGRQSFRNPEKRPPSTNSHSEASKILDALMFSTNTQKVITYGVSTSIAKYTGSVPAVLALVLILPLHPAVEIISVSQVQQNTTKHCQPTTGQFLRKPHSQHI